MSKKLNIVVVGAHVDDHYFAMGPTILKARKNGHNVTVIQAISIYGHWPVVTGREKEFKQATADLDKLTGVKTITLGYDYQRLVLVPELVTRIAEQLIGLEPDILFTPWDTDVNQDHVVIGRAGCQAGNGGYSFLPPQHAMLKLPKQIFQYALDVKAQDFRADSYVNVTDSLFEMMEFNNIFDELYSKHPLWPNALKRLTVTDHHNKDRTVTLNAQNEAILARSTLQGFQCGTRYADAFYTYKHTPADQNLLSLI